MSDNRRMDQLILVYSHTGLRTAMKNELNIAPHSWSNVDKKKQEQKRTHYHSIHIGSSTTGKTDLSDRSHLPFYLVTLQGGEGWEDEEDF